MESGICRRHYNQWCNQEAGGGTSRDFEATLLKERNEGQQSRAPESVQRNALTLTQKKRLEQVEKSGRCYV